MSDSLGVVIVIAIKLAAIVFVAWLFINAAGIA